jgi:PTS system beta-glucosides-specific IIC component
MDNEKLSREILDNIGGTENIKNIGHCATRLRINVKDNNKVNDDALSSLEGIHGYVFKNGQAQIIIGPDVGKTYNTFMEVSDFENIESNSDRKNDEKHGVDTGGSGGDGQDKKGFVYYIDVVGSFFAELFMPIVPALIAGGIILALNNFMINFFGIQPESGTSEIILAIFNAAFTMLPIYLGFTTARKLNLSPIMGALLGAILVNPAISGVEGLDFLGIPVTTVDYGGSVIPVILGVLFMYLVDKPLEKYIPEFGKYLLKPILTMLIVVPFTLILFGPIGTVFSDYVGQGVLWLMDTVGFIALPILSALYPYMVMLGIDKAMMPIGFQAVETLGFDPITMVMGFISNISVGASALAVSRIVKDEEKKGQHFSSGLTGIFGITEPAFYGALIGRPKALLGTAIGAFSGGLFAGIFSLVSYVMGGAPGLFTILFFLNPDGSAGNIIVAIITFLISVSVSYTATTLLLRREERDMKKEEKSEDVEYA